LSFGSIKEEDVKGAEDVEIDSVREDLDEVASCAKKFGVVDSHEVRTIKPDERQ